ncbi:MAG: hypothetical protein ABJB12_17460 [Pseudomonadota bacterium]
MRKRVGLGGFWAGLASLGMPLFFASRAQAQYAAPVFVQVNAGAEAFTVSTPHARHATAQTVAQCAQACGFWAWPGDYPVSVHLPGHDAAVTLRVRGPGNYAFVPEDSGPHTAGLVLGIAGPVVTLIGALMVVSGAVQGCDDANRTGPCRTPPISYYGAATFFAGAGMTAAGWVLYIHNRAHFQLSALGPPEPASARLGLIPLPRGGLGFGATLSF